MASAGFNLVGRGVRIWRWRSLWWGLAFLPFAAAIGQPIPVFLYVSGIPGELTNSAYAGWSEITFAQQGLRRTGTNTITQPDGFTVEKLTDRMSPRLLLACNRGTRLASAKLDFVRPVSTNLVRFYQVGLSNVLVTRYSSGGNESEGLKETVGFDYSRIDWSYTELDPKGRTIDRWYTWWDRATNTGGEGIEPGFRVQAFQVTPTSCQLTWTSEPGKVYEILAGTRPEGPYTWLMDVTSSGSGTTSKNVPRSGPSTFYLVKEK